MEEKVNYDELYQKLCIALETAAAVETQQKEFLNTRNCKDEDRSKIISVNQVALVELREYIWRNCFNVEYGAIDLEF